MGGFRKAKITAGLISGLRPGETVMCSAENGFGVRMQRGAPVYFVRKHVRGARHWETIGQHGTGGLTVKTARERAAKIISDLREGLSPSARRARDRTMPTIAEFAERWLDVHVAAKLKATTRRDYEIAIRKHIAPVIGKARVDQVDRSHVALVHNRMRATPYAANRALAIISKMLNTAEQEGLRPKNTNPAQGIQRYPEEARERFLTGDELAALGAALASEHAAARHSPYALIAIGFLLLTGMRLREVLNLQWSNVDLERSLLMLSASKTGRKPVLLGRHAVALLASIERHCDSPWAFPSSINPAKPMPDVKKAWRTVRDMAGLRGVRLHDLRHSYASIAAGHGGSLPMIGRLLGHTQAQTTQRYAHLAADPVRELADKTSEAIARALAVKQPI